MVWSGAVGFVLFSWVVQYTLVEGANTLPRLGSPRTALIYPILLSTLVFGGKICLVLCLVVTCLLGRLL